MGQRAPLGDESLEVAERELAPILPGESERLCAEVGSKISYASRHFGRKPFAPRAKLSALGRGLAVPWTIGQRHAGRASRGAGSPSE